MAANSTSGWGTSPVSFKATLPVARKAGTDTLFKLPKSESVPVFRLIVAFVRVAKILTRCTSDCGN